MNPLAAHAKTPGNPSFGEIRVFKQGGGGETPFDFIVVSEMVKSGNVHFFANKLHA